MSEAAAAAAEPKKGKKPMLLIIIALVVVAGGGGAAFFLMKGGGSAPAHGDGHGAAAGGEHGEKAEGGDHAAPAVGKGPIMELPPIIVNLNEPEGTRYLKANIAISLGIIAGNIRQAAIDAQSQARLRRKATLPVVNRDDRSRSTGRQASMHTR